MEKSWKDFWTTGKVEDYLTYRDRVENHDAEQAGKGADENQNSVDKTKEDKYL